MVTFTKLWIQVFTVTAVATAAPSNFPETSISLQYWKDRPVKTIRRNNQAPSVSGTDSGLYNEGFVEGDIVKDPRRPYVKNAVADPNLLWPNGIVVYKIEDDVGEFNGNLGEKWSQWNSPKMGHDAHFECGLFKNGCGYSCPDSPQCDMLMKAMDHYHRISCIRFKEWTGEDNYVNIFYNKEKSGACYSSVGRMGNGKQSLSLGQRCWYEGIIIHELGHAIGFWHEMNRPDRDNWIHVYWNNIQPGFSSAFAKYDYSQIDTLGETFDYRSIMMYDEYAFSKDGLSPTLQSTGGTKIGPIWKKRGLSPSDRRRLSKLYECKGNIPLPGFPYDISCRFDRNTCGFQNSAGSNWQWKTVNETAGYVHTSSKDGREPSRFVSPIIPGLPFGDTTRGPVGCARFYYLLKSEGQATLKVEQAYLSSLTAMKYDRAHTFSLWNTRPSGQNWKHVEIPIYVTSPFRLIFSAEFYQTDPDSVASLDVFEIFYKPCANPASNTGVGFAPAPPSLTDLNNV